MSTIAPLFGDDLKRFTARKKAEADAALDTRALLTRVVNQVPKPVNAQSAWHGRLEALIAAEVDALDRLRIDEGKAKSLLAALEEVEKKHRRSDYAAPLINALRATLTDDLQQVAMRRARIAKYEEQLHGSA